MKRVFFEDVKIGQLFLDAGNVEYVKVDPFYLGEDVVNARTSDTTASLYYAEFCDDYEVYIEEE